MIKEFFLLSVVTEEALFSWLLKPVAYYVILKRPSN